MTNSKTMANMHMRPENATEHPILSAKAMDLVLSKERMRCDRHGQFFSLIVIDMDAAATHFRTLVEILKHRLRLTDETGLLLKGGVGVLLPMTELHGANVVLRSVREIASRQGWTFDAEVFTYSGSEDSGSEDSCRSSDSDSDISFENDSSVVDTVVEDSPNAFSNSASVVEMTTRVTKVVRADDASQTTRMGSSQILSISTVPSTHLCRPYPLWKRYMDIACALIGLAVALPIVAIAAIAIKLTSKGPVFFRQLRTGQFGNAFAIYKLRTMVVDAEELRAKFEALNERDGPAFKMKNDPRVTRVGAFLRKTGLDELPQLWNVLIGDMAIVGPRPLPCNEDAKCELWQRRRLDTKPGLTCTWQITKSRKISFSDWMRMDLRYMDKRTVLGDIQLMFKTVLAVFLGKVGH